MHNIYNTTYFTYRRIVCGRRWERNREDTSRNIRSPYCGIGR